MNLFQRIYRVHFKRKKIKHIDTDRKKQREENHDDVKDKS